MIKVSYNDSKFNFLIDLTISYRELDVVKKPSQNQIADLINELYHIGNLSIGRKTAYMAKFKAMLWKMSQESDDQQMLEYMLSNKYGSNYKTYVGSML